MKKIFSIILLGLMCSIGNLWAAKTAPTISVPTATFTLPMLDPSWTWAGIVDQAFVTKHDTLVFNANELYQSAKSGSTFVQPWMTIIGGGTSGEDWDAIGSFVGSSNWKKGDASVNTRASLKSETDRIFFFRVSNCIGASALVKSGSNKKRTIYLEAYEVTGDTPAAASATSSMESSTLGTVSIDGLDDSKNYVIALYANCTGTGGSSTGNSNFYEIAFVHAPLSTPTITTDLSTTAEVGVGVEETFSIEASFATSYQWYTCDDALKTNPVAIGGATSASYSYTAAAAGTVYLYCAATNSAGTATSSVCAITASIIATHSVTYTWGSRATEYAAVEVPTHSNVAEGSNFDVAVLGTESPIKYNVTGWSDGLNVYEPGDSYTMGTSDVTLAAQWSNLSQSSISGATTWDWANQNASIELTDNTYPTKSEEFLMGNLSNIVNNASFNAQALTLLCQFPNRGNNHYFQGNIIKFNTTVPGVVKVWFSNTSNRDDNAKNRRYLYINNENCGVYTLNQTFTTGSMQVDAGEVVISAKTGEETPAETMIRVQKIVFTPTEITLGANGYSTYAAGFAYGVSGATVYKAAYNGSDVVTLTEVANAVVPANEGIILKGEEGATVTITPSNDDVSDFSGNGLIGVVTPLAASAGMYVLSTNAGVTEFNPCQAGVMIPAHKAYISIPSNAPAIRIIFAGNGATGINELEGAEKAVKFIENGKLYIQKDGVVYDATGAKVK